MTDVHSDKFEQLLRAKESSGFANLANSANGKPNTSGLTFAGVSCATPALAISYVTAQNLCTRNRAYVHPPVQLTSNGTLTTELYVRAAGAAANLNDPVFDLISQFNSSKADLFRQDTVASFATTTTLQVADAVENGWRPGMGFSVLLPGGRHFVGFIRSITDVGGGGNDTITFDPPMTTAERVAAEAMTVKKIRGGRTYALAEGYGAEVSLSFILLKRAYYTLLSGARGNTLEAMFETAKPAVFKTTFLGVHSYQGGLAPATTVVSWTDPTHLTVEEDAGANIKVGHIARVVIDATTYYVLVTAVDGDDITIEDAGLPSDIDVEDPVPNLRKVDPGSTAEPDGDWLKYLNGRACIGGVAYDVSMMNWSVNMAPQLPATPNNLTGAMNMISTFPDVRVAIEQSTFNDEALEDFRNGTAVSVLSMLSNGTNGNVVAMYSPSMHKMEVPQAGAKNDLIVMPIVMGTGLYTGDDGEYAAGASGADGLVDTTLRYFVECVA